MYYRERKKEGNIDRKREREKINEGGGVIYIICRVFVSARAPSGFLLSFHRTYY